MICGEDIDLPPVLTNIIRGYVPVTIAELVCETSVEFPQWDLNQVASVLKKNKAIAYFLKWVSDSDQRSAYEGLRLSLFHFNSMSSCIHEVYSVRLFINEVCYRYIALHPRTRLSRVYLESMNRDKSDPRGRAAVEAEMYND